MMVDGRSTSVTSDLLPLFITTDWGSGLLGTCGLGLRPSAIVGYNRLGIWAFGDVWAWAASDWVGGGV